MKRIWIWIVLALLAAASIATGVWFLALRSVPEYRALAPGDEGADVSNAQLRLRELQVFLDSADGSYSQATEEAVRRFEALNGLTEDGCLSLDEQKLLYSRDAIGSTFTVSVLDVGQGDAILLECDGRYMLIDGGGGAQRMYALLKAKGTDTLDVLVCTHPHDDHVGGLAAALNYASVGRAFSCVTESDNKAFGDMLKYLEKQGTAIEVPKAGDGFVLGSAEVTFLGPTVPSDEMNDNSLIMAVCYGRTRFLFTGDAEAAEEAAVLESGADVKADVLKVGHHGSITSSTEAWLDAVAPTLALISVGAENSYGHPSEEVMSRLEARGAQVLRTDLSGELTVTSNGRTVKAKTERTAEESTTAQKKTAATSAAPKSTAAAEKPEVPEGCTFVINASSKKFHRTDCDGAADTAESNRIYSEESAQALIDAGYSPCSVCAPEIEADYVINAKSGVFHKPGCSSVSKMKAQNREYFAGTRDELIARGLKACGACAP